MKPKLLVMALTDSFASLWSELAALCGAELEAVDPAAPAVPPAAAALVAAAGEETAARGAVERLRQGAGADVAVVGASTDYRVVAALLRGGASDYFALPADLGALRAWIEERVRRAAALAEARTLADEQRAGLDFSRLIGASPALAGVLDRLALVIPMGGATVLLTGETGTGKDLIAQAIHYNGPRAHHPLVELNCAALPPTLLEAELFGYEAGAFTDARHPKPGLLEVADGGTLFLDEIGDLPAELQAKLLRVIETRQSRRLGSVKTVGLDVRIIAATHVDLRARVREGAFRQDLYYRLAVVPVHLPPLRERGDDVLLLAEHFARRFAAEYALEAAPLGADVRAALRAHPWPGNVRELRNAIERAVILGRGRVRVADLALDEPEADPGGGAVLPFPATLAQIEAAAARAALAFCGGNKTRAAALLGISRKGLYALLGEAG